MSSDIERAERLAAAEIVAAVALIFLPPLLSKPIEPVTMSDDFYNTLFGAIVGGFITLIVSVVVNSIVAHNQEKDRRLGLAYSIRHKVMRMADAVVKTQRHVDESLEGVPGDAERWPLLPAFQGGVTERFEFTSEELALFQMNDEGEYANSVLDLASLHNLLAEIRTLYNVDRRALGYLLASKGYVQFEGRVASVSAEAKQDPEMLSRHIEVSDLAETLIKFSREGSPEAQKTVDEITPKLAAILDDPRFKAKIGMKPQQTGKA